MLVRRAADEDHGTLLAVPARGGRPVRVTEVDVEDAGRFSPDGAQVLTSGKVVDVSRRERNGWSVGVVTIEPFDHPERLVTIQIQNENLIAEQGDRVLAVVPDLICVLELDTAMPITTERLRYGQRVNVLGVKVPPIMRTPEALAVFGPAAFGLKSDYAPLGGCGSDLARP